MDSCRTRTEPGLKLSTWTICYLHWKSNLPLRPSQLLLSDLQMPDGLLRQCHGTQRPATSHTLKGLNYQLLALLNHFKVKLLYCLSCVCQSWVLWKFRAGSTINCSESLVLKDSLGSLYFRSWCEAVNCMYRPSPDINKGLRDFVHEPCASSSSWSALYRTSPECWPCWSFSYIVESLLC